MTKIVVVNFSGNVGKTTIARHLLAPRLGGCPILFVESINDGADDTKIKGKDFADVLVEVSLADSVVVDVGSSNIEQVFVKLRGMKGAVEDFDYFVVPTVPGPKQQRDTENLLKELDAMAVPSEKIKLIFNNVESGDDVTKVFPSLTEVADALQITYAVIHKNDGYSSLGKMSLEDAIVDNQALKALIASEKDAGEKRKLAERLGLSRLASGMKEELDSVFAKLFSAKV